MKEVRVEDAVGMVLAHDLTKIVPGEFKGAAFRKGHVVCAEDIAALKDIGKYHVFVETLGDGRVHEEEAAKRMAAAAAGENIRTGSPSEGKVQLTASVRGLLRVNVPALQHVNDIERVIFSTLHTDTLVEEGTVVAATKVIPLVVEEETVARMESVCAGIAPGRLVSVLPLRRLAVGVVVTGTEVYEGRIEDRFAPVLREKIAALGGRCLDTVFVPDDGERVRAAAQAFLARGAELVLISGGMSVDADDRTPAAITSLADEVVTYGSPVLPGAMMMLAYAGGAALVGVPACSMFNKTTVLDLTLPRIFAGVRITRRDITALGHGGLCLHCKVCRYPVCPFGK